MDNASPRVLGIFRAPRLQAYAYLLVAIYAGLLTVGYIAGTWVVDRAGMPVYTDFATIWVAGVEALHRQVAMLYDMVDYVRIQAALLGPVKIEYYNWSYPPTFSLFAAPFGLLPYFSAFFVWNAVTLLGLVVVVWLIVKRASAIALVLASPFTFWNFFAGQNGALSASLIGASLLLLERRPVLAGMFIGCLTYKPQFGLMFPIALVAARQWRAFASAAMAAFLLVCASALAFGPQAWVAFPQGFRSQFTAVLDAGGQRNPGADWGRIQTVYGLLRDVTGSPALAWAGQGVTLVAVVVIVWCVWRSGMRHAPKAAALAAAAVLATPYAFGYDLVVLSIAVAFLAQDQLRHGLLKGEQTVMVALFGLSLAALVTFLKSPVQDMVGSAPVGPFLAATLLALALRRRDALDRV
jgi:arabinofuranan 3-O-arabinosyltransferase